MDLFEYGRISLRSAEFLSYDSNSNHPEEKLIALFIRLLPFLLKLNEHGIINNFYES